MKTLQVITGLTYGGAEKVLLDLICFNNKNTVLLVLHQTMPLLKSYPKSRFPIYCLDIQPNKLLTYFSGIKKLFFILKKEKPNIIHAHLYHSLIVGLIGRMLQPSVKLIFTLHSSTTNGWFRALVLFLSKPLRSKDLVFSAQQQQWYNARQTAAIPNGIPLDHFTYQKRTKSTTWKLLFAGRLIPAKNPLGLIQSLSRLRNLDFKLDLLGEGPLFDECKALIDQLDLADKFKLWGIQTNVIDIINQAHLLLLPSKWEGMPITVLEAGASGLPILATPVGNLPEIITPDCGYLAPVEEFPQTIWHITQHYEEAIDKAACFRNKVVANYSIAAMDQRLHQLYESLL